MPYAAGDWICRACWKSNRPHDELCYRCRTPRSVDPSDGATSVSIRGDQLIPPVLVTLPAAFLRLYAVVSFLSVGALILLLAVSLLGLGIVREADWALTVVIVLGFIVVQLAAIWGLFAAARAITQHRRWGYLVGLAMTAPSAIGGILAMAVIPDAGEREWVVIAMWVGIAYYGALALLSIAALMASFVRRDLPADHAAGKRPG